MEAYKSYTDRIIQPTPIILGLKLNEFTLGHAMLLKSAKSKFLCGGIKDLTIQELVVELVFALLVCSTTYDDFKEEIQSGEITENIKEYVQTLTKEIKDSESFCLFKKVSQFIQYLKGGTTAPQYQIKERDESTITDNPIEPEEAIISTLMTDCGYTRNECLELPLTETLSAYLLYAYKQGTISLLSKEFLELKERMKGNHGQS
jgi:hypothetical protein